MAGGRAPIQNSLQFFGWRTARADGFGKTVSVPSGYPAPQNGFAPAITGGAMSTYRRGSVALDASAVGAMGLCRTASATLGLDASAIGGLVAGGVAVATLSLDASADIAGIAAGVASASVSLEASAEIMGIGHASSECSVSLDGAVDAYGIGWMVATTEQSSEMTEDTISAAVWARLLGGGIQAEDALLAAGAAGDPWSAPLPGSYTGQQAGSLLSQMKALLDLIAAADPWSEDLSSGYAGTQAGALISQIKTLMRELHAITGLEEGNPMTANATSRKAGDVEITMSGDGITSTTATRKK